MLNCLLFKHTQLSSFHFFADEFQKIEPLFGHVLSSELFSLFLDLYCVVVSDLKDHLAYRLILHQFAYSAIIFRFFIRNIIHRAGGRLRSLSLSLFVSFSVFLYSIPSF